MADQIKRINVIAEFNARTKDLDRKVSSVKKNVTGLSGFFRQAAAAAAGLFAVQGISAFAAQLRSAAASAVRLATEFEQTSIAFETFLGSAEAAKQVLQDLEDFSVRTPFEPGPIIETGRQLLAFGISVDKLIPTLDTLGNIAAGTGSNIQELAFVFGQAANTQIVQGEILNRFAERGINVFGELAKQFDTNVIGVKKLAASGKIGFADLEIALQSLTSEGGKFFGLIEKQSQSVGGLKSTLAGVKDLILRELGGIFTELQRQILPGQINFFGKILEVVRPLAKNIRRALVPAFRALRRIAAPTGRRLQSLFSRLRDAANDENRVTQFVQNVAKVFVILGNGIKLAGTALLTTFKIFAGIVEGGAIDAFELSFSRLNGAILKTVEDLQKFVNRVTRSFVGLDRFALSVNKFFGADVQDKIDRLDVRIKELDESFENLGGAFQRGVEQIESLDFTLPELTEDMFDLGNEEDEVTKKTEDFTEKIKEAKKAARELSDTLNDVLRRAFDVLGDSVVNSTDEIVEDGLDKVSDAVDGKVSAAFRKLRDIFRDTGDKIDEIKENAEELRKEQIDELLDQIPETISAFGELYDFQIEKIDQLIAAREDELESFRALADQGNAEQLQLEEQRLERLYNLRARFERRQAALNALAISSAQGVTLAKALQQLFSAPNIVVGITQTLAAVGSIAAIFSAINSAFSQAQSFAVGTEYLGSHRTDGEIPVIAHKGERIVPADTNRKLAGIANAELPQMADFYRKFSPTVTGDVMTSMRSNDDIVERLDKLHREFKLMRKKGTTLNLDVQVMPDESTKKKEVLR